jgi:uncharacterized membrane protein
MGQRMSDAGDERSERGDAAPAPRRASLGDLTSLRVLGGRPRLFIAMVCGIAFGLVLPAEWRVITRLLLGWNAATWLYFVLAAIMMVRASGETIKKKAELQDEGRFVILIMASLAGIAAIGAIVAHLATVKDNVGILKDLHIALAAATIVSAWTFIHLMYALHYAHDYFFERAATPRRPAKYAGGLNFPGTKEPDYFDFLYFSFVIGVACQTADVEITSQPVRRTALAHCVLAFFFNSAVLALTINIAASLIV